MLCVGEQKEKGILKGSLFAPHFVLCSDGLPKMGLRHMGLLKEFKPIQWARILFQPLLQFYVDSFSCVQDKGSRIDMQAWIIT